MLYYKYVIAGAQEWKRLPLEEKDKWNKQSLDYSESYAEKMWSVCKKVMNSIVG